MLYRARNAWHADLRREIANQTDRLIAEQRFAALGPDRITEFCSEGRAVKMWLPAANTDLLQRRILLAGAFQDMNILRDIRSRALVGRGSRVLDVGANIGNHSLFFAAVCGASVTALEPHPATSAILRRNAEINHAANLTTLAVGAGAKSGRASISLFDPGHSGGTQLALAEDGEVEIITLDSLDGHFDFLKIDVEGMAPEVIAGAGDLLSTGKPPVLVELHPHEFRKGEVLLRRHGYRQTRSYSEGEVTIDFLFERRQSTFRSG